MALKAVLESLDGVAEALHEHYTKGSDGKYYLAAEGVDSLPTVAGLKTNRDTLLAEKKALNDKLAAFEGVDADEYRRLKSELEKKAADDAKATGDWEAREKQLIEQHKKELEKLNDNAAALRTSLESYLIDAEAVKAIEAAEGNTTLLLPHVKSLVKVQEKDGKFVAVVVDPTGNPRIGDRDGNPMSVAQLVGELKENEAFGGAFKASGTTGSSAQPSGTPIRTPGVVSAMDAQAIANNADKIVKGEISLTA